MAIVTTDNRYYSEIAAAIREKSDSSDVYTPAQMAPAIRAISVGQVAEAMSIETIRAICYVPSDFELNYTALEYIQSSGTQYIDTGFKPNQNTGVTIDFQLNAVSGWQCLFGADNTGGNVDIYSIWHTGSTFGFYYASSNKTWTGLSGTARHTIAASKNTAVADGSSSVSLTASTFTTNYPLTLFMMNYRGTIGNGASMKLYSCQIYDNGTLVRSFVPCKRNSDGVFGLYDIVNAQFYGNAGSGSFAGA